MDGFGKRLVAAREKKGFTQKALAEKLGITATRLNYWEKDKREPDFFMFTKILDVLDADANEMLGLRRDKISNSYSNLNAEGRTKADDYIKDLEGNPKYNVQQNNVFDDIAAEMEQDRKRADTSTK